MSKIEKLKDKIMEIIKGISYINKDGGIEIYTYYGDRELSEKTISDIMSSSNPQEVFEETLNDWAMDYAINYGEDELEVDIKNELTEEEIELYDENQEEMWELIRENTYFYYDENDFNNDICVNIMVDCGNGNYDYTCDNVLNYYGNSGMAAFHQNHQYYGLQKHRGK